MSDVGNGHGSAEAPRPHRCADCPGCCSFGEIRAGLAPPGVLSAVRRWARDSIWGTRPRADGSREGLGPAPREVLALDLGPRQLNFRRPRAHGVHGDACIVRCGGSGRPRNRDVDPQGVGSEVGGARSDHPDPGTPRPENGLGDQAMPFCVKKPVVRGHRWLLPARAVLIGRYARARISTFPSGRW